MSNNGIIKIILFIFFGTFFGFLFWYFYQPEIKVDENGNPITEESSFSNLFPFTDSENTTRDFEKEKKEKENLAKKSQGQKKEILPQLRQISKIPTVGAYIESLSKTELFDINKDRKRSVKLDESNQFFEIRYISQKNNHIYQTYDFTKEENRISNITIPKISKVHFFNKNNFIIRYENQFGDKKNYSVKLANKTEAEQEEERKNKKDSYNKNEKKFQGIFFPDNIEEIFINQKNKKVFYTTFVNTDGSVDGKIHGIITTSEAENKKEIFSSKLKEWNFNFNNGDRILSSNKVSSKTPSIPFSINTNSADFDRISAAEISLNGISNYDFSKILFSQRNSDDILDLIVFDTKTKKKVNLSISTFVEKCLWSKNNIDIYCAVPLDYIGKNQPDNWYKGKNYFRDDIFKINTNNFSINVVFDTLNEEKSFDIIDLKVDDKEKYIYWKDKKTDFIWSYKLPYIEQSERVFEKVVEKTFSGKKCETNLILTQNLQPGDRNGKYSTWQKESILEVKILQKHMNRLGFNAGVEDGILGKNTAGAIKRMQEFLGTFQDAKVGPITRGLLNNSC